MMSPSVAIVILNYNGRKWLEQFLPSVLRTTYSNHTVWVADNASPDNPIPWLNEHFPSVKTLRNNDNGGYARGYNEALKKIQADYYVLLNSDVEVSANWLEPLVTCLETDPKRVAAQPKILDFNRRTMFEYAGAAGGLMSPLGYPLCRGRILNRCEEDKGQYDDATEIFWASGAALFIRRSAFEEIGGFFEPLFAHMEEIDLCWRLKNAGYTIWSCPLSVVYHVGGGTLSRQNPHKTFLNFRNNRVVLKRNLATADRRRIFFFRFFLDVAAAGLFLFLGKWRDALAVVRAMVASRNMHKFSKVESRKLRLKKLTGIRNFSFFVK